MVRDRRSRPADQPCPAGFPRRIKRLPVSNCIEQSLISGMEDKAATIASFQQELDSILHYWETFTLDTVHGGFFGRLTNDNAVIADAVKGSVLNARILWSFSAAYNSTRKSQYLRLATRSLHYIRDHFIDNEFGGVYWSVRADGKPLDTKKQIYALAFTIYGLTEYYRATDDPEALAL